MMSIHYVLSVMYSYYYFLDVCAVENSIITQKLSINLHGNHVVS